MWVGSDGVVVAPAMVVNEVAEFIRSFGYEVLLCRELLLGLWNLFVVV